MATMRATITNVPTFGGKPKNYEFTGTLTLPQVIDAPIQINSASLYYGYARVYVKSVYVELYAGGTSFWSEQFAGGSADDTLRERTLAMTCGGVGDDHILKVNNRAVKIALRCSRSTSANVCDRPRAGDMYLDIDYTITTTACTPPTAVSVDRALSEGQAAMNWSGAAGGVNNWITGYQIQAQDSADGAAYGNWFDYATVSTANGYGSFSVDPHAARGYYRRFRLRTLGAAGAGYFSGYSGATGSLRKNQLPSAPGSLTASPATLESGNVTLSWPVCSDPDGNLSRYRVQAATGTIGGALGAYGDIGTYTGVTASHGLSIGRGEQARYRVRSEDGLGAASDWVYSGYVTRNRIPAAPASMAVSPVLYTSGNITLNWPASSDEDGNLAQYRVQYRQAADGAAWGGWADLGAYTGLSAEDTWSSRTGGAKLQYRVRAEDSLGAASAWAESSAILNVNTVWSLDQSALEAGGTVTASLTPADVGLTHKLIWQFGEKSHTDTLDAGVNSKAFLIDMSWLDQIPNATNGQLNVILETYSGSVMVASSVKSVQVTVPASVVPTIESVTAARVNNGVPDEWGLYVQGHSGVTVTVNGAAGAYGSTIKSYRITGGGFSANAGSSTFGPLNTAGSLEFTALVTDSRGRTAEKTAAISVTAYDPPRIASVAQERCDEDGVISNTGAYLKFTPDYTYSEIGSNAVTVTCKAKQANLSQAWRTLFSGALASEASKVTGNGELSHDISWDIQYTVADALETAVTPVQRMSTARAAMHLRAGGNGAAFGKLSERENAVEVADGWDVWHKGRKLTGATLIPQFADLNDYATEGLYYNPQNAQAETIGNVPAQKAFSLMVEKHAGIKQTFTIYSAGHPDTWSRNCDNGVWGDWYKNIDTGNLQDMKSYLLTVIYPVGSIYMSTANVSPAAFLGGTWTAWGAGKVPVGVNALDADFASPDLSGGAKAVSASHSHTVASHAHTIAHTHTVNSHAHTVNGHTHTVNDHNHLVNGHTLTVNEMPSHNHMDGVSASDYFGSSGGSKSCVVFADKAVGRGTTSAGGGKAHDHGRTGGASSLGTGSTALTTNATSPATGGSSAANSGSAAPGTDAAAVTVSTIQPYVTCYMWQRTA